MCFYRFEREIAWNTLLLLKWLKSGIFQYAVWPRFAKRGDMTTNQYEWTKARDELVDAVKQLGFPEELGTEIAKNLGSLKAMSRMMGYLSHVKPKSAELIVDEMLAICSEIAAWKEKKAGEEANANYNGILHNGLGSDGCKRWEEDG